jgi:aminomethyltransferase
MSNRRTPLYDWHVARKARMVPFGGWDMPVQYSGILEEHKAVRQAAGLFDISHMARFSFVGAEALPLLEKVFTNSVATMKDGQVRYGLVCNEQGGILDDVLVYKWPKATDHSWSMVVNASNRDKVGQWIKQHARGVKAAIDDVSDTTAMIALQGPRAVEMVRGQFEDDATNLKYYFAVRTRYRGGKCVVSRTGYTGEDGFEFIVPAEQAEAMWTHWIEAGAVPCGLGARDTLRLEAAMPLYGHELSEAVDPLQAGLGWAVKLEKGDFLGRAALVKATMAGPRPVRIGLKLEGKRAAREGSPILHDGAVVGTVTSGSYTPHLEQSIAMGYVPAGLAKTGTALAIDLRGTAVPATVVDLPFYKKPKA